jgi:GT2 family glycosyltransferase
VTDTAPTDTAATDPAPTDVDATRRLPPTLVAVCTKDRPDELAGCLAALGDATGDFDVLVVDASTTATGDAAGSALAMTGRLHTVRMKPHLAAQRNAAVDRARQQGRHHVVFVDDDVRVEPAAVSELVRRLDDDPAIAAVGAVVVDEPPVRLIAVKAAFRLWSRRPGAVLVSGRNVIGHSPTGPWPRDVEWLATCATAFRLGSLGELRFDERRLGYSYGEDLDLTFRLSHRHRLAVEPRARVSHQLAAHGRPSTRALARRRTVLLHDWVVEQRPQGLRMRWFWWSVLGECLLLLAQSPIRRGSLGELRGVLGAVGAILRGTAVAQ